MKKQKKRKMRKKKKRKMRKKKKKRKMRKKKKKRKMRKKKKKRNRRRKKKSLMIVLKASMLPLLILTILILKKMSLSKPLI